MNKLFINLLQSVINDRVCSQSISIFISQQCGFSFCRKKFLSILTCSLLSYSIRVKHKGQRMEHDHCAERPGKLLYGFIMSIVFWALSQHFEKNPQFV
jgi:hypothetical protein